MKFCGRLITSSELGLPQASYLDCLILKRLAVLDPQVPLPRLKERLLFTNDWILFHLDDVVLIHVTISSPPLSRHLPNLTLYHDVELEPKAVLLDDLQNQPKLRRIQPIEPNVLQDSPPNRLL